MAVSTYLAKDRVRQSSSCTTLDVATQDRKVFIMRRSAHLKGHRSSIRRSHRRRLQFKNIRRVAHHRRLSFFLQENIL